jgi:hypothetical protein
MFRRFLTLAVLLVVGLAIPAHAYTIYLKDGSTLVAKEKYRIEDGKALIILQNGTQTFIDASEIDVDRTYRVNKSNYGTAFFIDDEGKVIEAPVTPTERKTLAGLASNSDPGATGRDRATRNTAEPGGVSEQPRTAAGHVDLTVVPRTPFRDLDISVEVSRFLRTLGVTEFKIFQGTQPGRAFLEMTANSEATVFRCLETAADTLVHLQNQFPGQIQELEVLLTTSNRDRAGQFLLDEELAAALGDENSETAEVFIAHVQF